MNAGSGRLLRWTDTDREIARLAVPALGALIAEPLYILADTAVVGHLGTSQLGGLSLASQALLSVHALSIFLAYGTTAAVSRLLGAERRGEAAFQAIQSIWLALAIGIVGGVVLWAATDPILEVLGGEGDVLTNARVYLRVSLPGLPAMLTSLACVGYLRGLQDTVRPLIVAVVTAVGNLVLELVLIYGFDQGIGASALSTVVAQWVGALLYLHWVRRAVEEYDVALRPDPSTLRRQLVVAGDLFLRDLAGRDHSGAVDRELLDGEVDGAARDRRSCVVVRPHRNSNDQCHRDDEDRKRADDEEREPVAGLWAGRLRLRHRLAVPILRGGDGAHGRIPFVRRPVFETWRSGRRDLCPRTVKLSAMAHR